jgi:hypothetical protein
MRIRDPDPGWKKGGSGILNPEKHTGSATLVYINIFGGGILPPDPDLVFLL